jgi:hypothetical protein
VHGYVFGANSLCVALRSARGSPLLGHEQ